MASASNVIFKISIPSWDLHNATKKKNHRSFKLENRFFSDDKISQLSAVQTRFYLYLLTVASDLNQSSYTLTTNSIPSYFRLRTHSIQSSLTKFESLQLLKHEKRPPNTIQNKTKEEKAKENNIVASSKNEVAQTSTFQKSVSRPNSKTLVKISSPKDLADLLDEKNKQILFELYNDPDFIKREFYKIQNWLDANPRKNNKTSRGWLTFVASWLDSGWPKHQKNIDTNKPKASSVDELMSMMGW